MIKVINTDHATIVILSIFRFVCMYLDTCCDTPYTCIIVDLVRRGLYQNTPLRSISQFNNQSQSSKVRLTGQSWSRKSFRYFTVLLLPFSNYYQPDALSYITSHCPIHILMMNVTTRPGSHVECRDYRIMGIYAST